MASKSKPKSGKKPTRAAKKGAAAKSRRKSAGRHKPTSAAKNLRQKKSAKKPQPKPAAVRAKRSPAKLSKKPPQVAPKISRESLPARQAPRPSIRHDSAGRGAPYYITTAIAYPNGPPHIGHAYEAIATDAIARFTRLDGFDVFFLTGTDEHGIKMLQTAAKEGITPKQLVERNVPRFKAMVAMLNCSNDEFIRTTEPRHHRASEAIWEAMEKNGDIYLDKYSGWYSVRDEAYYDESETRLDAANVRIGPNGTPVEWVEEESYFFRLSAYHGKLLELYASDPNYVLPRERFRTIVQPTPMAERARPMSGRPRS